MIQPNANKMVRTLLLTAMAASLPAAASVSASTGRMTAQADLATGGVVVWFNSVMRPTGVPLDQPVTICVTGQVITYQDGPVTETIEIPDAVISYKPWETTASTHFSGAAWQTSAASTDAARDVFMSGAGEPLPAGLPATAVNLTWSAHFASDRTGVAVQWQWGHADYSQFSDNYEALGVAAVDRRKAEHAGTPLNFKGYLSPGAGTSDDYRYVGTRGAVATAPAEVTGLCGGIY